MNRVEGLLQAVTDRFRDDKGLQQDITRELRSHLEDSIDAARRDGMTPEQAEDAAIRAFGDAEEVGRKLWQANLRRLVRRALLKWGGIWLLVVVGVVLIQWAWTAWSSEHAPLQPGIVALLIGGIYLVSLPFIPASARLGLDYPLWLLRAFWKSMRTAFGVPWVWVPVAVCFVANEAIVLPDRWRVANAIREGAHCIFATSSDSWATICFRQPFEVVHPQTPSGWAWVVFYVAFLLYAARFRLWLASDGGLGPERSRRWYFALIVGAWAGVLSSLLTLSHVWITWQSNGFPLGGVLLGGILVGLVVLPVNAFIESVYLNIVLDAARGRQVAVSQTLRPALIVIWPLLLLSLIPVFSVVPIWLSYYANMNPDWDHGVQRIWDIWQFVGHALLLCLAFVSAVIVTERYDLGRALARQATFVARHLWRYVLFVAFGAVILAAPKSLLTLLWGSGPTTPTMLDLWAGIGASALQAAIVPILTVMCFHFYLTKAGTEEIPPAP